jgi:hypothetical protein
MNLWVIVNLVAPVAVPILGALLVSLFVYKRGGKSKRGHPLAAFKDGQLCWVVMGMCFNSLYELATPSKGITVPRAFSDVMEVLLIGLMLGSVGIAVLGSALPVPWPKPPTTPISRTRAFGNWVMDFPILLLSVLCTATVIYVAWNVHLTTQA